ncbi:fungal-specific transcription factor domain-domain-containing protein [Naematelia encephala]|uniref:Fungal-specific transcription factor domain-domain-containing protein n=1 Tax=Naematelia encephala TaxID=71784 RepID=A0A1Y2B3D3_9TREE|nr:fungal-specific transcription factor domain-domain-containing protein [Naematelia encephala]
MSQSVAGPSWNTKGTSYSGGKARSWVPRACDRCRKRKARCDEAVPCRNCSEAGVACTHDAPVLKRGPRPRQHTRDVEDRLRNLEHLISSIPGGSSAATPSLTSGELDQIRLAAHATTTTPGSDSSPGNAAWTGWYGDMVKTGLTPPMMIASASVDTYSSMNDGLGHTQSRITGGDMWPPGHTPGPGPGPGPSTVLNSHIINSHSPQPVLNHPHSPPTAAVPGQDLLYRDVEGQTKWLGPSSGMPLLDRLKISESRPAPTEEWLSLSVAIGLEADEQPLPPSAGPVGVKEEGPDDEGDLWGQLLDVCPQDLVDSLVQAYFTISHLLWPILHYPTFLAQYHDPAHRRSPSFVCLVMSLCCLSSRYTQDPRLPTLSPQLLALARVAVARLAAERSDVYLVQALFNMSVVQEGTLRPSLLWTYLSQALSMAIDLGLHRRVDEWSTFSAIDIEVRRRTMWALYCQNVKASCTFGRPPLLRLSDLDLDEPAAVDDVYISAEGGIGVQPDRPSVMAGFVAAIRLHMILERTIRRMNRVRRENPATTDSFLHLITCTAHLPSPTAPETELLPHVTDRLPGEWTFNTHTVSDPDNVRFFQKTRVFTLSHFIRLLVARGRFAEELEATTHEAASPETRSPPAAVSASTLGQIAQSALGIIGTYGLIDGRGRLGFFGAHAIAQLTQAGAGLIGIILHLRATIGNESILHVAIQGLPAAIKVLRQLGKRRPAGLRAAELLTEFSRACKIPVFIGFDVNSPDNSVVTDLAVEVPMLRSLPRRESVARARNDAENGTAANDFDQWLGIALMNASDAGGWAGGEAMLGEFQTGVGETHVP